MEEAIETVLSKKNIILRPHQEKVIKLYLSGKDVLLCSPTGSGKSLTFELAPYLYKELEKTRTATIFVVSPLIALMKEQTEKSLSFGLKAVYLKEISDDKSSEGDTLISSVEHLSLSDIKNGDIDIIFTSPESLLGHHRGLVTELEKGRHIKAIFIDEAHCISKYGTSTDKKKDPFRPVYSQLGELRSLTKVPIIALTATATLKTRKIIIEKLCINKCEQVLISPDKHNIKYWFCEGSGDVTADFAWLGNLLLEKGKKTPRIIIFFRRTRHIGELYEHLTDMLGEKAYIDYKAEGPNDDRNRLFDMFHSKTDDEVKESICSSYMNPHGTMRVVLVSTSFSMGLDVQGVDTVLHYGPANDVEDYIQETGRAGRDQGTQAHAILMKYKRCLSGRRGIQPCIKQYCKQSTCRRVQLLQHFTSTSASLKPPHKCCDICATSCNCLCQCTDECNCPNLCTDTTCKSLIMDCITSSHDSSDCSSSSSTMDESSDSDFETSSMRKRVVLTYSSESE